MGENLGRWNSINTGSGGKSSRQFGSRCQQLTVALVTTLIHSILPLDVQSILLRLALHSFTHMYTPKTQ